jgi:tryptophan synthase alpha chain
LLLPYVTGGYPDVSATVEILKRVDPATCACVEIGIPFSDSIADGPVIQASFSRALAGGFRVDALLEAIRAERDAIAVPLLGMVSYSVVYRRGPEAFVDALAGARMDGMVVPDLVCEEAEELAALGRSRGCPLVMMIAPTTEASRRPRIASLSEPFVYYQSLAGVTGERAALPADLTDSVRRLKQETDKPVCVGFGIATAAQVRAVCSVADGAIVGSAIVRRLSAAVDEGQSRAGMADAVAGLVHALAEGLAGAE